MFIYIKLNNLSAHSILVDSPIIPRNIGLTFYLTFETESKNKAAQQHVFKLTALRHAVATVYVQLLKRITRVFFNWNFSIIFFYVFLRFLRTLILQNWMPSLSIVSAQLTQLCNFNAYTWTHWNVFNTIFDMPRQITVNRLMHLLTKK